MLEDLRKAVLARLQQPQGSNDLNLEAMFPEFAPYSGQHQGDRNVIELYAVFWQLVREGIIVPGNARHGLFRQGSNDAFRKFPFFEITAYGREVLKRLPEDTDPASATAYLDKLRVRAPLADQTVLRYVGESVSTFNNGEYLASAVLLGVAAESLLEQLFAAIGSHVNDPQYDQKLEAKRWISQRLEYARARLEPHLQEFDAEFRNRVDQYLDMLAQILKLSRDDVGHSRPLRVDREVASMNLVAFPVLAGIVNELMALLGNACTLPP